MDQKQAVLRSRFMVQIFSMSGHSRWAQIHRQKGSTDTKRGALFTRLGNVVTVAAKAGGGNPETNFRLRLAIDQAKAANVPKDNIERAIKRGTGEGGGGPIDTVTYEGFGPGGVALMVECLTDNRNRTSASMKHLLTKHGGNLGGPNSVSWLFEPKGVLHVSNLTEALELELIDAGALDISRDEDGVTIYTAPAELQKTKIVLEKNGIEVEHAELEQVAKEKKPLTPAEQDQLEKLFAELDENEDVNNYYTNAAD